ncbi:hypothetical protein EV421DRAFT_1912607 [Armillaria borealis]|uniref:Uncharacterized protein n=1 Tax=Armillaria borealis TaxID=47425 RepID=A0AA39MDW4_9AGAR|nr:hypothetical protein EV421DRAFT_1912607 [Armillaria borealis]
MSTTDKVDDPPPSARKFVPTDDSSPMALLWKEYKLGPNGEGSEEEDSHSALTRGQFYSQTFILKAQDIADEGFSHEPLERSKRYRLKDTLYKETEELVRDLQGFLQRATALVPGRQRCYHINPGGMLMVMLKGSKDIPMVNVSWKVLQERMTRGHEFMVKYATEYQETVPPSLPISTAPGLHTPYLKKKAGKESFLSLNPFGSMAPKISTQGKWPEIPHPSTPILMAMESVGSFGTVRPPPIAKPTAGGSTRREAEELPKVEWETPIPSANSPSLRHPQPKASTASFFSSIAKNIPYKVSGGGSGFFSNLGGQQQSCPPTVMPDDSISRAPSRGSKIASGHINLEADPNDVYGHLYPDEDKGEHAEIYSEPPEQGREEERQSALMNRSMQQEERSKGDRPSGSVPAQGIREEVDPEVEAEGGAIDTMRGDMEVIEVLLLPLHRILLLGLDDLDPALEGETLPIPPRENLEHDRLKVVVHAGPEVIWVTWDQSGLRGGVETEEIKDPLDPQDLLDLLSRTRTRRLYGRSTDRSTTNDQRRDQTRDTASLGWQCIYSHSILLESATSSGFGRQDARISRPVVVEEFEGGFRSL